MQFRSSSFKYDYKEFYVSENQDVAIGVKRRFMKWEIDVLSRRENALLGVSSWNIAGSYTGYKRPRIDNWIIKLIKTLKEVKDKDEMYWQVKFDFEKDIDNEPDRFSCNRP